jgi:lysyl-tRNA synthetase class 2
LKYAELFREHVGFDLGEAGQVRARARELYARRQISIDEAKADDAVVVNALFEHYVEPTLVNPTFVIDYPAPLCPLTRRHPDDSNVALRFEAYVNGTEIGNAYTELNDPAVQRETFSSHLRGEGDETMAVMDEDFVEALEYGMPPAGGLGIGIDRLVMLLTGSPSIRDVLLFPLQRPERTRPAEIPHAL